MKFILTLLLLLSLTAALLLAGLFVGSFETDMAIIFQTLFNFDPDNATQYVIINLRLPRLILAFLVGGALALSGYLLQAMVNNPLADPYILGTASGAALGANIVFFGFFPAVWMGMYLPPLFAFLGALSVTFLVVAIAYRKKQIIPTQLLLAGVAISSLLTATTSLLTFLSDSEGKLRSIVFWTFGSFERAQWPDIPLLLIVVIVAVLLFYFLHKQLNLILLGEERAYHLGLNVSRLKWLILIVSSLVTAVAVATSGTIGFVGLIIPHIVRSLFGMSGRFNITLTVWIGGIFLMLCDLLSRIIYPPAGLPIGIVTSFLGVPFFLSLLLRKNYRFD